MREVEFRPRLKRRFDAFVLHLRVRVDDVGEQILVFVVDYIAHADDGQHIAHFSYDAAEVKTYRAVRSARFVEFFEKFRVHALGEELHLRAVERFKRLSVLEGIIVFGRDRRDARLYSFNDALAVLHALRAVGQNFEDFSFKPRPEPVFRADGGEPVEVPADQLVKLHVVFAAVFVRSRQALRYLALIRPFDEKLVPIAEMNGGQSVDGFVVKNIHSSFAVRHFRSPLRAVSSIRYKYNRNAGQFQYV